MLQTTDAPYITNEQEIRKDCFCFFELLLGDTLPVCVAELAAR